MRRSEDERRFTYRSYKDPSSFDDTLRTLKGSTFVRLRSTASPGRKTKNGRRASIGSHSFIDRRRTVLATDLDFITTVDHTPPLGWVSGLRKESKSRDRSGSLRSDDRMFPDGMKAVSSYSLSGNRLAEEKKKKWELSLRSSDKEERLSTQVSPPFRANHTTIGDYVPEIPLHYSGVHVNTRDSAEFGNTLRSFLYSEGSFKEQRRNRSNTTPPSGKKV